MKHFRKKSKNIIERLIQPLWLNKHICINNYHIYYKHYENYVCKQIKKNYTIDKPIIFKFFYIFVIQLLVSEMSTKTMTCR